MSSLVPELSEGKREGGGGSHGHLPYVEVEQGHCWPPGLRRVAHSRCLVIIDHEDDETVQWLSRHQCGLLGLEAEEAVPGRTGSALLARPALLPASPPATSASSSRPSPAFQTSRAWAGCWQFFSRGEQPQKIEIISLPRWQLRKWQFFLFPIQEFLPIGQRPQEPAGAGEHMGHPRQVTSYEAWAAVVMQRQAAGGRRRGHQPSPLQA